MARLHRRTVRGIARWLMLAIGFLLTPVSSGLAQEPAPATQLSKAEAKIQEALDSRTEMDFVETPLKDVATFLAQLHNIPVQLDTRALEDAAIPSDLPITFKVSGVKLRSALKLMLAKHDLGFHYRHEALVITTADVSENDVITRVYPIHDLLGEDPDGDSETWVRIIQSMIKPDSWGNNGGPGGIAAFRGRLVVVHTEEMQRSVQMLLEAMRRYQQAAKAEPPQPLPTAIYLDDGGRTREAWNAIFAKELALDFVATPLSDVAKFLSQAVGVPFVLDERALEDSAIPLDLPISYQQRGVSLRAALGAMLLKHDLDWVLRDGVVLITTIDAANNEEIAAIYPVADLVRTQDGTLDPWELADLLQSIVSPWSWRVGTGPGDVMESPCNEVLFVPQTRAVHEEIEDLLIKLRQAAPPNGEQGSLEKKLEDKPDHSRNLKVFELYEGVNAALVAAIARDMFEPQRWPAPEGEEAASPLVSGVPGRVVVRHEKAFIDLVEDFMAQAEVAGGTNRRSTDRVYFWPLGSPVFRLGNSPELTVRCYRLSAVWQNDPFGNAAPSGGQGSKDVPLEPARDGKQYEALLREVVLPDTWGETGPGRVRGLPGLLIVRHTPEGQQEVVKLLKKLISPEVIRFPHPPMIGF